MKKDSRRKWLKTISFLAFFVLLLSSCISPGANSKRILEVRMELPKSRINQGHVFDIKLILSNPGIYNTHITKIVLPKEILNSSRYIGSDPALTMLENQKGEGLIEMNLTIAPNGEEKITFRFEALTSGSLKGTGRVETDEKDYSFEIQLQVAGSNPDGWEPGISPLITPSAINEIPWQSVVQIEAIIEIDGREVSGWEGSGTIISPDGLILTNAHVVLSDRFYPVKKLIVKLTVAEDAPPVPSYYASIVQADESLDIAIIKPYQDLQGNFLNYQLLNLPFAPLGDSNRLKLGDEIKILGYPGIGGETITLTTGEVSGFTAEEPYGNRAFIKTSGTIAGGNSGGLAINAQGELIGVPTQVGSGGWNTEYVDCRALFDTNRDGYIDSNDTCVPTGGFINALRPINLAMDLVRAASLGEVAIVAGSVDGELFESEGLLILEDDFSDPKSGWAHSVDDEGVTKYENGEYVIQVNEPMYLAWSDQEYFYDSLVIEADLRVVEPVGDADFGFVCGMIDYDNFFALEISEDGFYSIWKTINGQTSALVDWTYSQEVASGGPFRLSAHCSREQLILALNGTILASSNDPDFTPGGIGMIAGTFEIPGVKVAFDNLKLRLE